MDLRRHLRAVSKLAAICPDHNTYPGDPLPLKTGETVRKKRAPHLSCDSVLKVPLVYIQRLLLESSEVPMLAQSKKTAHVPTSANTEKAKARITTYLKEKIQKSENKLT